MSEPVELSACTDCFDAVNFSDHELGHEEGTLAKQLALIEKRYPAQNREAIVNGSEPMEEFSTRYCEACGNMMGGPRFPLVIITV